MSRGHHRRMILIIKRRTPKINQLNSRTQQHPPKLRTPARQTARAWYIPVIGKSLIDMTEQEDILRLQVGMHEVQIVQERNGVQQLFRKGLNV